MKRLVVFTLLSALLASSAAALAAPLCEGCKGVECGNGAPRSADRSPSERSTWRFYD